MRGYFEFDDHPDHRMVYVNMPDMAIMKSRPRFMLVSASGIGIGAQEIRARDRAMIGDSVNRTGDERVGLVVSFVINFRPSAIGWSRPRGPTKLGPLRSCMYPSSFRSKRVRNATAMRIGRMYSRGLMMLSRTEIIKVWWSLINLI